MNARFDVTLPLLLAALVLGTAACERAPARVLHEDLAHTQLASRRIGAFGTASYPRVELDRETRVVCNETAAAKGLSGLQLAADIDLPAGARIDLAYGVTALDSFSLPVDLSVTLVKDGAAKQILLTTLDGTAKDFGHWHEASLDASAWTGKVRLEVTTASQVSGLDEIGGKREAIVHVGCPLVTRAGTGEAPRGIILISLDTLRADRLGVYGYERKTSPNIDRFFGERGVVVDRALSPATNTLRAHAGMLSGIQPAICVDNWPDPTYARMGAFPTLADVLQANGFRTAAFTENGYVSSRYFGLGAGFELFVERTGSPGNPHIAGTIEETFARGLGWIQHHRDESFFLFLHTYQVHAPYRPSPKYRSLFPSTPGASRARVDSDLYDGEVAETDAAVGRLIDGLHEAGLLDRTLIVVTSDHGEEFGEHGGRYHGAHLHQEILHVPLLFYGPEFLPKTARRAGPVSLVDLPPTILDLAGIAVPGFMTGRSFAEQLRQGSDAPVVPSSIYSEAVAPKSETYGADEEDWLSPALAVTRWPLRMIRERTATGTRYRLYDLDADPRERTDLIARGGTLPAGVEELQRGLDAYEADSLAASAELREALGVTTAQQPAAAPIDDDRTERLKALGYVD